MTLGLVGGVQSRLCNSNALSPSHSHKSSSAVVDAEAESGCPCVAGAVFSPGCDAAVEDGLVGDVAAVALAALLVSSAQLALSVSWSSL